jgi:23S rRNA G2445 N2-methylase RlmL
MKLKKVNFEEYLPMTNSTSYRMPFVKATSYRSKLYHEKMIENILLTSLNKFAYKNNEESTTSTNKVKPGMNDREQLVDQLVQRTQCKIFIIVVIELPRLDIVLQGDKAKLLLDLSYKPLYLHGYKKSANWGGLRETYASALIYESIIRKLEGNNVYLWDPFCGSGTNVIEAFLLTFLRPVRNVDLLTKEAFTVLPFFDAEKFKEFCKGEKRISSQLVHNIQDFDCKFIASDINSKSIDSLIQNVKEAKLDKYTIKSNDKVLYENENLNMSINPNLYHERVNNVFSAFIGDFENIANQIIFSKNYANKKFIIFSHIPYGLSKQLSDKTELKHLYRRIGKFLRRYSENIEDVFILVNKRDNTDDLNFKKLSELGWEVVSTFSNNGVDVEFLKMEKIVKILEKKKREQIE